ncbi:MAG: hydroxymethylglutaryl-CoA synthase family protein, partial [Acidimicrobiia bacterium]|nr:hydroxymethylglutaryl-CoA synthase family protein [Acidimicrobiia bacterium]
YIPYWRLDRSTIGAAMGTFGKGTRAVASYDEDTTTMGVEAARACLASAPEGIRVSQVLFVTSDPAYLDKTNATAIHAALDLDPRAPAFDMVGSVNSANGAIGAAMWAPVPTLVVMSDIRTGLPGGADESGGGDGAVAFLYAPDGPALLESLGVGVATSEFLDRYRQPGDNHSHLWEERFGEHAYTPLAEQAVAVALKEADLGPDDIDYAVVTGVHPRAVRVVAKSLGLPKEALVDDLTGVIGNTGAAHSGIVGSSLLDTVEPGKVVLRLVLADGAMASLSQTTEALVEWRSRRSDRDTVAAQISSGRSDLDYPRFLTWRGQLHREPPRRPDPTPPVAPASLRKESWKFAFHASRCEECGTRHLPPTRVCVNCGAVDRMTQERLAETPATIATYTVDRLAFSLSPPIVATVVDFDGGGRFRCEMTDVDPDTVAIGNRVEMTFRRISTVNGIHNYFWKARPSREEAS